LGSIPSILSILPICINPILLEERRQICDTPIVAKGDGELYRKQCETHLKVV
jgi:hypothetical protein